MSVISFSGLASGIDSSALIQATLEQSRKTRIDPLKSKVEAYTATNDSYTKLKELLTNLYDSVQSFRTINGSALSKKASSSSESRITASASNSASNGSYSVTVSQLAKNGSASFNDRFSDSNTVINSSINNGSSAASRTVTVDVGTGSEQENVAIELTNSSTLSDFVNQFNAQSSKAEATVVNVGTTASPSYAVVINALNEGTAKGQLALSVGSEITTAGSGAFAANTLSQATDASFSISGVAGTFTRSTNSISDAITGVTLSLVSTGTSTISISDDSETTKNTLQTFVENYNEILKYIAENDTVGIDDNQEAVFGSLAGTSLDEGILSALRGSLSSSSISGGLFNTLADLGVTTQRDGRLKFDSTQFQSSIDQEPESLRSILTNLGESLGSVSGTIQQFTRFNGLIDTSFNANTADIDKINKQITDVEGSLSKEESSLKSRFSRLESLIGKLNSQQSALGSIISSI